MRHSACISRGKDRGKDDQTIDEPFLGRGTACDDPSKDYFIIYNE
jgi:hypothetical protein